MKFLIIDDEPNSRLFLQEVMLQYFKEWKLLGVCSGVNEGVEAIKRLRPDLVLLDIEIAEGSGFDVINAFEKPDFNIIFISAFERYALKAIKYAALDYILKPIDIEELGSALKKIRLDEDSTHRLNALRENLNSDADNKTIMFPTHKGFRLVAIDDIAYLEANGQYIYIHLIDQQKILATKSLGYYEELLGNRIFFRIHKSYIVNVSKVARVITNPTPKIELVNNLYLDLAFRRKEAFIEKLRGINRG